MEQKQEHLENTNQDGEFVSITEAAKINNVTRQAIYVAIKQKKLKARKTSRWEIDLKDLQDYRDNKYSRTKSVFEGELLFDKAKGLFSVNEVADKLAIPAQKVYYAMRTGTLKASRKGAAWVISEEDIEAYKQSYLEKKRKINIG